MILDGRAKFNCSLLEFYRRPELAARLARRGVLAIPPLANVAADAAPTVAYVNPLPDGTVRWIADCPDCLADGRAGAEYVWLDHPLLFLIVAAHHHRFVNDRVPPVCGIEIVVRAGVPVPEKSGVRLHHHRGPAHGHIQRGGA